MKAKIVLAIIVVIVCALTAYREFRPVFTMAITDEAGAPLPQSISLLEEVTLGNMQQWIQIRGNDISNPVLLWLHGGPGSAQMPISEYNKDLEQDFIVVHWDQRGAGKSNPPDFDAQTMTIEQYIQDAHELTTYLKQKLNKDKIYLLGHSWGTMIGIALSEAYPDDYYAYIGVSQVVDNQEAQLIAYEWICDKASERDAKKLAKLGVAPYTEHDEYVSFIHMVDSYGGGM